MGNLANRYGLEAVTKNLHDPFEEKPKSFPKARRVMVDEVEKTAPVPDATVKPKLVELREQIAEIPARKAKGRPKVDGSINSEKPWEAEGISRMTWYRRQKQSAKLPEGQGEV